MHARARRHVINNRILHLRNAAEWVCDVAILAPPPREENQASNLVSDSRHVRLSQPAHLLCKHNDVMAVTRTNEVTVFHFVEGGERDNGM